MDWSDWKAENGKMEISGMESSRARRELALGMNHIIKHRGELGILQLDGRDIKSNPAGTIVEG
jgi:hypothetical protein